MSAILEREQLFSNIWQLVGKLSLSEKLKLSEQLTSDIRIQWLSLHLDEAITQKQVQLSDYAGIGKELWQTIDVDEYIRQERDAWEN